MASALKKPRCAYHKKEDKKWDIVRKRIKEEEESAVNYR
jgi:hypothetical protein